MPSIVQSAATRGVMLLLVLAAPAWASLDKCSKSIGGESRLIQAKVLHALQKCNDAYRKDQISASGNFAASASACETELGKAIGSGGTLDKEVTKLSGFLDKKTCTNADLIQLGHLDESNFGKRWTQYIGVTAVQSAIEQQLSVVRDTINILRTGANNGCTTCNRVSSPPCQEHACTSEGGAAATINLSSSSSVVAFTGTTNLKLCTLPGFSAANEIIVSGPSSISLTPATIPGVGFLCVQAIAAEGYISCGSTAPRLNYSVCEDHVVEAPNAQDAAASGACSGQVCLASTADTGQAGTHLSAHTGVTNGGVCYDGQTAAAGSGDAFVNNTWRTTIVLNAEVGPDGQPCTADDTNPAAGTLATIGLTTGTARATVLDADNQLGVNINSAVAAGAPFNCDNLSVSNLSGAQLAGAIPALHAFRLGTSALDSVTAFTISCN